MATRDPAPGSLEKVRAFVNTLDVEAGEDAIASRDGLRTFLSEQQLLGQQEDVSEDDAPRARQIREALRKLLLANHEDESVDGTSIMRLNASAGDAGLMLRFAPDGTSKLLPQASGLDGALGRLLAIVYAAMEQDTWERLKVCKREGCRWAFYDHSKNHSSKWCSMAVCGNREKARAYRRRKKIDEHRNGHDQARSDAMADADA